MHHCACVMDSRVVDEEVHELLGELLIDPEQILGGGGAEEEISLTNY